MNPVTATFLIIGILCIGIPAYIKLLDNSFAKEAYEECTAETEYQVTFNEFLAAYSHSDASTWKLNCITVVTPEGDHIGFSTFAESKTYNKWFTQKRRAETETKKEIQRQRFLQQTAASYGAQ